MLKQEGRTVASGARQAGEGLPRQHRLGLLGMGFCCFPAGFSLDGPAPASHHSWSPVLDPNLQKQDFLGMAWDGVLAPPSSLGRVLGGTCSCHTPA